MFVRYSGTPHFSVSCRTVVVRNAARSFQRAVDVTRGSWCRVGQCLAGRGKHS